MELEPPKPKLPPREEPQPDKAAVPPQPDKAVVPPEEADLSDEEAKLRKLLSTKAKDLQRCQYQAASWVALALAVQLKAAWAAVDILVAALAHGFGAR